MIQKTKLVTSVDVSVELFPEGVEVNMYGDDSDVPNINMLFKLEHIVHNEYVMLSDQDGLIPPCNLEEFIGIRKMLLDAVDQIDDYILKHTDTGEE